MVCLLSAVCLCLGLTGVYFALGFADWLFVTGSWLFEIGWWVDCFGVIIV